MFLSAIHEFYEVELVHFNPNAIVMLCIFVPSLRVRHYFYSTIYYWKRRIAGSIAFIWLRKEIRWNAAIPDSKMEWFLVYVCIE